MKRNALEEVEDYCGIGTYSNNVRFGFYFTRKNLLKINNYLKYLSAFIMTNYGLCEEDFYRISEIERDFQVIENLHDHRFGNIALMQCI